MIRKILISGITLSMMLFLLSACAEDEQSTAENKSAAVETPQEKKAKPPVRPAPKPAKPQPQEAFQSAAIMNEPVDFSSAEQVTATMDKIKQDAGDEAASRVKNAIDYMIVYDLSVGRDREKLYKKLNGKTPNQIMAMTGR